MLNSSIEAKYKINFLICYEPGYIFYVKVLDLLASQKLGIIKTLYNNFSASPFFRVNRYNSEIIL
jgi:hypothetical protein